MSDHSTGAIVKTTDLDNVGIVSNPFGLQKGSMVLGGIVLTDDVPMGHKVALQDMPKGSPVIRYGQVIGYTSTDIVKGSWLNETNIEMPQAPALGEIPYKEATPSAAAPITGYTFQGFRNADGSVGTKNVLVLTESVQCVAGIANYVTRKIKKELLPLYPNVDDVVAFSHSYGCGIAIEAPGASIPIRTIKNISQNPNFGDGTMIIGLGCEKLRPERLMRDGDTNVKDSVLYLQDEAFRDLNKL